METAIKIIICIVLLMLSGCATTAKDDEKPRESLAASLIIGDNLARAMTFQTITEKTPPEARKALLTTLWDDGTLDVDETDAVRASIIFYIILHGHDTPRIHEDFAARIRTAAQSGSTGLRWAALDYYIRKPPSDPTTLIHMLEDKDDALRSELLAQLWRLGARPLVRSYVERHTGDQERIESVTRSQFFINRDD